MFLLLLIEEDLDDFVLSLGMIEVDEQTPVNEPCPVLQSHQVKSATLIHTKTQGITFFDVSMFG